MTINTSVSKLHEYIKKSTYLFCIIGSNSILIDSIVYPNSPRRLSPNPDTALVFPFVTPSSRGETELCISSIVIWNVIVLYNNLETVSSCTILWILSIIFPYFFNYELRYDNLYKCWNWRNYLVPRTLDKTYHRFIYMKFNFEIYISHNDK